MPAAQKPVMRTNERTADRVVRTVVGAVLLAIAFSMFSTPFALFEGIIVLAIGMTGAVSFLTGLVGWCPFYAMLGFSSCAAAERPPVPR